MKRFLINLFGWAWIALLFLTSPADMIFRVAFYVLVLIGFWISWCCYGKWNE
jgi:hypothetical protein